MLWVALISLLVATAAWAVAISIARAERRARRMLLRTLGVPDDAVDALLASGQDLTAQLAYIRRRQGLDPAQELERQTPGNPPIRLVHPTAEDAPPGDPASDRPAGWRSRQSR